MAAEIVVWLYQRIASSLMCTCKTGAQPQLKSWGGPRFGSQHRGACAPRPAKSRLNIPLPLWRYGGITPGKFLKTQMLNPAFWWLLAVIFVALWKLRQRSWRDQYIVAPQRKSWGASLPRSLRLLRLWCKKLEISREPVSHMHITAGTEQKR